MMQNLKGVYVDKKVKSRFIFVLEGFFSCILSLWIIDTLVIYIREEGLFPTENLYSSFMDYIGFFIAESQIGLYITFLSFLLAMVFKIFSKKSSFEDEYVILISSWICSISLFIFFWTDFKQSISTSFVISITMGFIIWYALRIFLKKFTLKLIL